MRRTGAEYSVRAIGLQKKNLPLLLPLPLLFLFYFFLSHNMSGWSSTTTPVRPPPQQVTGGNILSFSAASLPSDDFRSLLDLKNFSFLINNKRCEGDNSGDRGGALSSNLSNENIFLVIFVHSAPGNFAKRMSIRSTWGNESNFDGTPTSRVRLVFLVGQVPTTTEQPERQAQGGSSTPSIQQQLTEENDLHADLVQGNFIDSYRNLTYKHVMGLKWVTYFCPNVSFVFKTDDDIYVDIFQLMSLLRGRVALTPGGGPSSPLLLACYVIRNPYPKRSQRSKWRVSFREYPAPYYPPYCSGWGIIMSPLTVFALYTASRSAPFFWVDDVLITGVLARKLRIPHEDLRIKLALDEEDIEGWLKEPRLTIPPLFGHTLEAKGPEASVDALYALWAKTLKYYTTIEFFSRRGKRSD